MSKLFELIRHEAVHDAHCLRRHARFRMNLLENAENKKQEQKL